jgi:hypothetical protein
VRRGERHVHGGGAGLGYADPEDGEAKAEHYRLIQSLGKAFAEKNGSIICRELLDLPAGADDPVPAARTPAITRRGPARTWWPPRRR